MRYCILGPLEVRDGARVVPLAQGRQRVLLAVLLLQPNETVSSDRLIDALWGESPPPTAAGSLHNLVSGLRKALGEGVLVTQGGGYRLSVADDELDHRRFEALVERGRAASVHDDAENAATLLREALSLWRGSALADLAYEPALQDDASRLDDRRLTALEERIDADLACGRHADLAAELDALTREHPLRERLRGQQMLSLYRAGRQADALQVYGDTRRTLVDELGIEPGPELRRLEQAVLDQDPALGTPGPLPPPPPMRSPLVARVRRHPRRLIAAGAVLLAAAVAAVILANGSGPNSSGLATTTGNSLVAIDPASTRVLSAVSLGPTPTGVAVGAGAVWALSGRDQTIARVDARTRRVDVFGVGADPTDVAAGAGALWVRSQAGHEGSDGQVVQIDANTQAVRARILLPVPRRPEVARPEWSAGRLAVAGGAVWVVNSHGKMVRIDARNGLVTATVPGIRARAIAGDANEVWAISAESPRIVEVGPRTAAIRGRLIIDAADRLDAIAVGEGAVWVTEARDGTLWRIDPGLVVNRTIPVGIGADGVAAGAGSVWVINSRRRTLLRIDPRENRVVATVRLGRTPRDVEVGAGAVWVTLAGRPNAR